jgi:hypothetical protein
MKTWRWIGAGVLLVVLALFVFPFPAHSQVASVILDWTAPGDDADIGTATTYEMRWATSRPDTTSQTTFNAWWAAATPVAGLPAPLVAGTAQSVTVAPAGGFTTGRTYYFVLRTADEVPNWSGYSNVAWKFIPDTIPPRAIVDLRVR